MGMFLNSREPFERYKEIANTRFFIDKTKLIDELLFSVCTDGQKYLCLTRPRRFGKSVMANMIGAFFEKDVEGTTLFDQLYIAKSKYYREYINQYPVIYIDFSRTPDACTSYGEYIERIQNGIKKDLIQAYPTLSLQEKDALWDIMAYIFSQTNERFIFVMDEWDAVFHMPFVTEQEQKAYLLLLKNLLKDQVYVSFAYMTGVLPIAKYSSGSELNMFLEYDMATSERFSEYFGFSEREVEDLYNRYLTTVKNPKINRDGLRVWYDGYFAAAGKRLYNPRSIVSALADNQLRNYWTSSGPYDEIFYYIKNNIEDVRDDLVVMISGEGVFAEIQNYAAVSMNLNTRDEIYSAMVVYGLLTYDDETGMVYIPNREIMEQFKKLLMSKDSLGYVYRLANESERMLKATLSGDIKTMCEILEYAHDTETPILSYNNEVELSAVVNLVYLAARDQYRVEREDKAGKGYVDFIFYPEKRNAVAFILELKVDKTPEDAIEQIKDKKYALRFKGKLGEKEKYSGEVLAVGIGYNKETKEHACKVETL